VRLPTEPAKPWFSSLITLLTGTQIFSAGGAQQHAAEQVPE